MTETMGQIIKRLRKEHSLTQEELAEQLNISAPAVSKWENDTSMPDISQVVPLANLFGVPTDVLFGVYGTDHKEEVYARLEEIHEIYDRCKDGEEGQTALIILDKYRDAIRTYPNNDTILSEAMSFSTMIIKHNESDLKAIIGQTGIDGLTDEVIRWAELVIKYSSSIGLVLEAKRRIIDIYIYRKNWDAAFSLAETLPNNTNYIRCFLMTDLKHAAGDTEGERMQLFANIHTLSRELGNRVAMLGNLYMNEGKLDDAIYCYTFLRNMIEAMYGDEKYRPPFHDSYYPMYRFPAECLVKLGREEEAMALLGEGVNFILTQAENYNKKKYLDVPLLREYPFRFGHDGKAEYHDLKGKLKRFLKCDTFKCLEERSQYKALIEQVEHIE